MSYLNELTNAYNMKKSKSCLLSIFAPLKLAIGIIIFNRFIFVKNS